MIRSNKVDVYRERLYCDKCSTEMESDGITLCSYPVQIPYTCPNCGWKYITSEVYPKMIYKEIIPQAIDEEFNKEMSDILDEVLK